MSRLDDGRRWQVPSLMAVSLLMTGVEDPPLALAAAGRTATVLVEITQGGNALSGLTAEDLVILDKGRSVPLTAVSEFGPELDAGAIPDDAYRQMHLLFDLEFSSPLTIMQSTDVARSLIAPDRLATTEISIATHEPGTGLRIEQDLGADHEHLSRVLDTLRGEHERRLASWGGTTGPTLSGEDLITSRTRGTESARGQVQREQGRILGLIRSLARLEDQIRSIPGGSQVVVFSSGFDSSVILGNQATDRFDAAWSGAQAEAAAVGDVAAVDGASRFRGGVVEEALFDMLQGYARSGIRIEVVRVEPTGEMRRVDRGARAQNGLRIMANRTGGRVLEGPREELVEQILTIQPSAGVYLLGFQPRSTDSGRYRKLGVRLRDRGEKVKIFAPPGYIVP